MMFKVSYHTGQDAQQREGVCVGFVPNYAIIVNTKTKRLEQANLQDVEFMKWSIHPHS